MVIGLRNAAYNNRLLRQESARIPVVSVGNIQVGGTGKTPLAAWMLALYQEAGYRVAYLSRGYGRKTKGFRHVDPKGTWQDFGDEALLIANRFPNLPVAVCEDRVEGVEVLANAYDAEVVVLDDAFQHRRIKRDFDLVSIDVSRPWKEDRLLPFGRLREPWSSLGRVDWIVASKLQEAEQIASLKSDLTVWEKGMSFCRPNLAGPVWCGLHIEKPTSSCVLFSGLGNNALFAQNIEQKGIQVLQHVDFPDHHPYSEDDLVSIKAAWNKALSISPKDEPPTLLTTEKDYFRIRNSNFSTLLNDVPWGYVPMELQWLEGEQPLTEQLLRIAKLK